MRVSDLSRSLRFYCDVFECRVALEEPDAALPPTVRRRCFGFRGVHRRRPQPVGASPTRASRVDGADRNHEVVAFYRDDLGLAVLAQWRDHDGYDGAVFGLPGAGVQLEITQHGSPPLIPPPHPENQLVLYLRGEQALRGMADRLTGRGHRPVAPANPYWARSGAVLFADPDGWLVVLTPWVSSEPLPAK
ncbi:VOC family protein [Nocardia salmonicida]|uniref:VOC family protein n=1 Tax=Nocardia salmonicida TaxID=53431 RepID=UPI0037B09B01